MSDNIPKAHPKIVGQAKKRVRSKKNAVQNKRSKGPSGGKTIASGVQAKKKSRQ